MQTRKREKSPCQVPCHLGRTAPAGAAVVGAGGGVVGAGPEVAGAVLVALEAGQSAGCMSHIWCWQQELNSWEDKLGRAPAESKGRRRRHGTLQSAPRVHADPGGGDHSKSSRGTTGEWQSIA